MGDEVVVGGSSGGKVVCGASPTNATTIKEEQQDHLDEGVDYNTLKDFALVNVAVEKLRSQLVEMMDRLRSDLRKGAAHKLEELLDQKRRFDNMLSIHLGVPPPQPQQGQEKPAVVSIPPPSRRQATKLKEDIDGFGSKCIQSFREHSSKCDQTCHELLNDMVDIVKQSVDSALDDHSYRIRTELLWIKGKYQEKLEACRSSKACEMRDKYRMDQALLQNKKEALYKQSTEVIQECMMRFRLELSGLREKNEDAERRVMIQEIHHHHALEKIAALQAEIDVYEAPYQEQESNFIQTNQGEYSSTIDVQEQWMRQLKGELHRLKRKEEKLESQLREKQAACLALTSRVDEMQVQIHRFEEMRSSIDSVTTPHDGSTSATTPITRRVRKSTISTPGAYSPLPNNRRTSAYRHEPFFSPTNEPSPTHDNYASTPHRSSSIYFNRQQPPAAASSPSSFATSTESRRTSGLRSGMALLSPSTRPTTTTTTMEATSPRLRQEHGGGPGGVVPQMRSSPRSAGTDLSSPSPYIGTGKAFSKDAGTSQPVVRPSSAPITSGTSGVPYYQPTGQAVLSTTPSLSPRPQPATNATTTTTTTTTTTAPSSPPHGDGSTPPPPSTTTTATSSSAALTKESEEQHAATTTTITTSSNAPSSSPPPVVIPLPSSPPKKSIRPTALDDDEWSSTYLGDDHPKQCPINIIPVPIQLQAPTDANDGLPVGAAAARDTSLADFLKTLGFTGSTSTSVDHQPAVSMQLKPPPSPLHIPPPIITAHCTCCPHHSENDIGGGGNEEPFPAPIITIQQPPPPITPTTTTPQMSPRPSPTTIIKEEAFQDAPRKISVTPTSAVVVVGPETDMFEKERERYDTKMASLILQLQEKDLLLESTIAILHDYRKEYETLSTKLVHAALHIHKHKATTTTKNVHHHHYYQQPPGRDSKLVPLQLAGTTVLVRTPPTAMSLDDANDPLRMTMNDYTKKIMGGGGLNHHHLTSSILSTPSGKTGPFGVDMKSTIRDRIKNQFFCPSTASLQQEGSTSSNGSTTLTALHGRPETTPGGTRMMMSKTEGWISTPCSRRIMGKRSRPITTGRLAYRLKPPKHHHTADTLGPGCSSTISEL